MARRTIGLLFDERTRREVDLVRALYDRGAVETTPPFVPVVAPFEEGTSSSELLQLVGLIVAVYPPFVLELATPEHFFDGEEQQLRFVAVKGAEESLGLSAALYRDVFPHQRQKGVGGSPVERAMLTVGRFARADEAVTAAEQLREKTYFCVISEVGMLEAKEEGGWDLIRAVDLGSMIAPG
jgi:hypothetical protein